MVGETVRGVGVDCCFFGNRRRVYFYFLLAVWWSECGGFNVVFIGCAVRWLGVGVYVDDCWSVYYFVGLCVYWCYLFGGVWWICFV